MPSLLYVGDLGSGSTSQDRFEALASLGAEVDAVSPARRIGAWGKIDWLMSSRFQISRSIQRFNAQIAAKFAERDYDILWLDKAWMIQPGTLRSLRPKVQSIVLFNNDNPWGEHERGMWGLHKRIIPLVDEVIVPKYSVIRPYERKGARRVSVSDFGFSPERHFSSDTSIVKTHDICFIGTALKDGGGIRPHRTELVRDLAKLLPGRVSVFGDGWKKALRGAEHHFRGISDGVYDRLYRETIWRSKINLSFVTKDNWEESSHKAFEITACGGCLLAERSSRLEQTFLEDREALYFSKISECAERAAQLLDDDLKRNQISQAGHTKAVGSGFDNRSRLADVIARSPVLRGHFAKQFMANETRA